MDRPIGYRTEPIRAAAGLVLTVARQARWDVSSGFGELITQVNALVAAGDLAGARELLDAALDNTDPNPANASPELTEAAGLYARVLVALGDPRSAHSWAAFAYAATTRLHGPDDHRTVGAAATLAAVLHRVGNHDRAARLYRDVIIELTAMEGPESLRVLAAHADLATVEYARGDCQLARERLADAWQLHREVYGDAHPSGIRMLARLGAMQRDCGLTAEADEHLELAVRLCRDHLSADHPLAAQVAARARAAPDPNHHCTGQVVDVPEQPPDPPPAPPIAADSTASRTSGAAHPVAPGVHRVGHAPATRPGDRLPATVHRPVRRPPDRRMLPVALVGTLVVFLGTAAVIAGFGLAEDPAPQPQQPSAKPTPTDAAPAPGDPPRDVRLRDNRDSVKLTWVYPSGAEGPVVVSGGRTGQERRALQELAPGSTSYVLYGLSDRLDYCFSIAVVYSADHIAHSAPVCTDRAGLARR